MAVEFKARTQGKIAETYACEFLQNHGLTLLQKNYSCPCGEIDLIMQDRDEIVFVEVRLRHHTHLGSAVETVNKSKQRKLIKTALLYLQKKGWLDKVNSRFDVVGIESNNKVEWIKNAFSVGFF